MSNEFVVLRFGSAYISPATRGVIVRDIVTEREQQIEEKGWTPEHDRLHGTGHLISEAIYRLQHPGETPSPDALHQTWTEAAALLIAALEVLAHEQATL